MRLPRPCLTCNRLHRDKGDYCAACRADHDRKREANPNRIAKKRMMYGGDYPARRASMVTETINQNLPCHICKKHFATAADITADHLIPGNPNSPLAPAHKSCNSSRGNKPL